MVKTKTLTKTQPVFIYSSSFLFCQNVLMNPGSHFRLPGCCKKGAETFFGKVPEKEPRAGRHWLTRLWAGGWSQKRTATEGAVPQRNEDSQQHGHRGRREARRCVSGTSSAAEVSRMVTRKWPLQLTTLPHLPATLSTEMCDGRNSLGES